MSECPICRTSLEDGAITGVGADVSKVKCLRCGKFEITDVARTVLPSNLDFEEIAKIVYSIRKRTLSEEWARVEHGWVEDVLENTSLPDPHEQADALLLWAASQAGHDYGRSVTFGEHNLMGISGAVSLKSARLIFDFLKEQNWVVLEDVNESRIKISVAGWDRIEQLRRGVLTSRRAFMAMSFENKEVKVVVNQHFRPAVERAGFSLHRLDDGERAGLIDDRLTNEIRTCRFMISDLTDENRGAYWEAGYAEGLGKPVIYTCKKERWDQLPTHFDTNHRLTVMWEECALEKSREKLTAVIRATFPGEAKMNDEDE